MHNDRCYIKIKVNEQGYLDSDSDFELCKILEEYKGKEVFVCIVRNNEDRSIKQNKFFRGVVVPKLAELSGHTEEETKDILQKMFLTIDTPDGKKEVLKTSQLTVNEFGDFLNSCVTIIKKFFRTDLTPEQIDEYDRII